MQVTQTEEIQLQAKTDCNVDKTGGVPGKYSDLEKDSENEICVHSTNRFAVLVVEEEGEILGNVVSNVKVVDKGLESLDSEVSHNALNYSSGGVKVKLAEELKSLGPVDSDYQKKKELMATSL